MICVVILRRVFLGFKHMGVFGGVSGFIDGIVDVVRVVS
jgi:hypothetical protein